MKTITKAIIISVIGAVIILALLWLWGWYYFLAYLTHVGGQIAIIVVIGVVLYYVFDKRGKT